MKKALTLFAAFCLLTMSAFSAWYPSAGNDTQPNVWTKNFEGVKAAALKSGHPILLIMVKNGCGNCANFSTLTLQSAAFKALESSGLPFYKVLINFPTTAGAEYEEAVRIFTKYKNATLLPLVAVLNSSAVKTSYWTFSSTNRRNVTSEIEQALMKAQGVPNPDAPGVVEPTPPSSEPDTPNNTPLAPSVSAKDYKGSYTGFMLDANDDVCGTVAVSLNARGSASVRLTSGNVKQTIRCTLSVDKDGKSVVLRSQNASFSMEYSPSGLWTGYFNDTRVLAKKNQSAKDFTGMRTLSCDNGDNSDLKAGFFVVKVTGTSGSATLSGRLNDLRKRVSMSAKGLVLTAEEIRDRMPAYDIGEDALVVHLAKGSATGTVVLGVKSCAAKLVSNGTVYTGTGRKYDAKKVNLSELDGEYLTIPNAGNVGVVFSRSRLSLEKNDFSAKLTVNKNTAAIKGTYKIGTRNYKYEGVLSVDENDALTGYAIGAPVSGKAESIAIIRLGHFEDCDCSVDDSQDDCDSCLIPEVGDSNSGTTDCTLEGLAGTDVCFTCFNSSGSRLELEEGYRYTTLAIPLSRIDGTRVERTKVQCVGGNSKTVSWKRGELEKVVDLKIPARKKAGQTIALKLSDASGKICDEMEIHIVEKQANAFHNPYWLDEKSVRELQFGDWTFDYEVALEKIGKDGGNILAVFSGQLWCRDCININDTVLSTSQFKQWASDNKIVLVVFDQPISYSGDFAPVLLSYANYLPKNACDAESVISGASYMSRKNIDPDDAAYVMERTKEFSTKTWLYSKSGKSRLANPEMVLVNKDGNPVAYTEGYKDASGRYPLNENLAELDALLR